MDNANVLLPREIDLDKCITANARYDSARIELDAIPRLLKSVVRVEGPVVATITFDRDLNSMRLVKGTAEADVVLVCERCNEEFVHHLCLDFVLTPDYERAKACNLLDKYEFIDFTDSGKIDLYDIIEDGLILEIPAFPRHDEDDPACSREGTSWSYGEVAAEAKESPFAALAALKGNLKQ